MNSQYNRTALRPGRRLGTIVPVLLMVYGTLRRGFTNDAAKRLHREGQFFGEGFVRGRLVRCGPYRGLLEGSRRIHGEVFRVPPGLFRMLDRYEGRLFRRKLARVWLGRKGSVRAWIYYYCGRDP